MYTLHTRLYVAYNFFTIDFFPYYIPTVNIIISLPAGLKIIYLLYRFAQLSCEKN